MRNWKFDCSQREATLSRTRFVIAGDSAHLNNSVGGLGLNGGIHDAMELVDTLHQVVSGQADESSLDRYTRRRRTLNIEFVQEQTILNKKRLEEREPPKPSRRTTTVTTRCTSSSMGPGCRGDADSRSKQRVEPPCAGGL
jgi:2-polyprenyl-6-methoxyphenol hydroxylase-like FAD-dependent oxidoreductase